MRRSVRQCTAALAVAMVVILASVLTPPGAIAAATGEGQRGSRIWIVFDQGGRAALPNAFFHASTPTIILHLIRSTTLTARSSQRADVELFTSYAAFAQALAHEEIPRNVRYVAFDPEKWSTTPMTEQLAPRRFMRLFTRTAHARGLHSILVPGLDLLLARGAPCSKHPGTTLDQAFVRCDLAAGAAGATMFVIQGAPVERYPRRFITLVRRVAHQVHRVSRSTKVLVTLVTGELSEGALVTLAKRVRRDVQGFEINTSPTRVSAAVRLMHAVGT